MAGAELQREKNVMKKIILFVLMPFAFISVSFADEETALYCSSYEAVYTPHTLERTGEQDYKLKIEKNEQYTPTYGPKAFFTIDTFNKSSGVLLSTYKAEYICTSGNQTSCYLQLSENLKDRSEIQPLNKDFSPLFSYNKNTPYALIIPNSSAKFGSIEWEKVKPEYIQFYGSRKIKPDYSVPTVWIFDHCVNEKNRK